MNANEKLRDLQIRHAVHVLAYGRGLEHEIVALLDSASADVGDKLAARLAQIEERGFDHGPATTARLTSMIAEIAVINETVYREIANTLKSRLIDFAGNEAEFQVRAVNKAIGVDLATVTPSPHLLEAIVAEKPFQGALLKDWVEGAEEGRIKRLEQAVRLGIYEGEGTDKIVRRIMGSRSSRYRDGIMEVSRRSARSMVRTAVSHVTNAAAQATWKANDGVIGSWQFCATLDNRTTMICASLDGRTFPLGEGPIPPRHIRCRSITTAVTKSFRELGLDRDEAPEGTRASMDGQVAASVTFDHWLKGQGDAVQNDVLGATRAKLFRQGKLNLNDFVRNNSDVLTLDELRKLHPGAFV